MITLFGKKKKEDERKDLPQTDIPQPAPIVETETDPDKPEESPFAKIFQSISQDYRNTTPPTRPETVGAPPLSVTPDWVQPRELPRSKPMVITPYGARSSPKPLNEGEDNESVQDKDSRTPNVAQSNLLSSPSNATPQPTPPPPPFRSSDDERATQTKASPSSRTPDSTSPAESENNIAPPSTARDKTPSRTPPTSIDADSRGKRDGNTASQDSPTFKEGLAAIDSSGEFSLSGFDDISKLLAETDSVLAQGREKERELATDKPIAPGKEPVAGRKDPEQSSTVEKQEREKQRSTETNIKGFEHIFELTQGSLNSPGLAVIDGTSGSGKTTLCLGLADRYLKQGSPCIFVTYSQSPAAVRDEMKRIGCDIAQYEANYRFMMIDAFSAQSGTFSMELYSLMEPWDISRLKETVVGNCAVFIGENVRIIIDSLDGLVAKIGGKDFANQFDSLVSTLKETNATVVASVDLLKSGKEVKGWAEDESDCLVEIDLEKGKDRTEHSMTVNRAKGAEVKGSTEEWDLQPSAGLVFV